ncbi:hypothetical protein FRC20_001180 [Serendipita sp. 405]|nr:hypothetical protein FRC20_001180 [Serendipita sp. 405]
MTLLSNTVAEGGKWLQRTGWLLPSFRAHSHFRSRAPLHALGYEIAVKPMRSQQPQRSRHSSGLVGNV